MNFWQKNTIPAVDETRADRLIQKKRRKQNSSAKGLGAVAIPRSGPRAIHQRNEDRHVLRDKTAHALIAGESIEVQLLNLSSNGVMIACKYPAGIGDDIALEIDGCSPITTAVRWIRNGRMGLEFIAETEIIAEAGVRDLIVKTIRNEAGEATYGGAGLTVGNERRDVAKRHQLLWVGKLKAGPRECTARLRNISTSGAMISLSDALDLSDGAAVGLTLSSDAVISGRIRWHAGHELGMEFDEPYDVSLLVNAPCAELAEEDDAKGLGTTAASGEESDFDTLRIRLGKVENPHHAPDMEYGRLTLDEIYATLRRDKSEPTQ